MDSADPNGDGDGDGGGGGRLCVWDTCLSAVAEE